MLMQGIKSVEIGNIGPILLVGVLGFVEQILRNRAYTFGRAAKIAMINYSAIAYTYLLDIFVLRTGTDKYSMVGSGFITAWLLASLIQDLSEQGKSELPA